METKSRFRKAAAFTIFSFSLLVGSALPGAAQSITLLGNERSWVETGESNSLVPDNTIFRQLRTRVGRIIRTDSTAVNIHAHYRATGASGFRNYIYTGAMRLLDENGGVGVTFYSDYPNTDSYYRLRRYAGEPTFHIAPHGTDITAGDADSGVIPVAKRWYRFKVWVRNLPDKTRIRAKVWRENRKEPRRWQIDCEDSSETRRTRGKPGGWSMADGRKEWKDLRVRIN